MTGRMMRTAPISGSQGMLGAVKTAGSDDVHDPVAAVVAKQAGLVAALPCWQLPASCGLNGPMPRPTSAHKGPLCEHTCQAKRVGYAAMV